MRNLLPALLLAASAFPLTPALAQAPELDELQRQLATMQTEVARLSAQVAELQARDQAALPPPSAPTTKTEWKGGPELSEESGWSFKPRGRLQVDAAVIDAPSSIPGNSLGFATEFRRAYLGLDGTIPGGFGYRVEADFANSSVNLTDVYLTYKPTRGVTLTLGQHKPFGGLEEMTSDVFTTMMERAAFVSGFGFERRVGLSGTYAGGDVVVQLGAFTDNAADLNVDSNNSYSLDGRVVFSPKIGEGILHIGGSAHFRELNDAATTVRYRARPFVHTTDLRLIDTRPFSATGERNFGAELAYIHGPFHVTLEGHRMTAIRPGLPNPTFWGGFAEVGLLITPGDKTGYRSGAYDRIRPVRPIGKGGIGAIQFNARYDRLDLTNGAIVGGLQQTAGVSAVWIPTDYVRFLINYGRLWITDAAVPAGADTSYQVDVVGMRAQIDF
jgi:phosphate-selective porin OprO and OprP